MPKKPLSKYKQKRKFDKTPEPAGAALKKNGGRASLRFVVQKHLASHLHYDFRLEHRGVLLSWAVPKGPSLNPKDKRLAMMVEDHPFEYRKFEGIIPEGNYGAGTVMIWDQGSFHALGAHNRAESEHLIAQGLHKGHITFILEGSKLRGEFALIKLRRGGENAWLLVKAEDAAASSRDIAKEDLSAASGKTMDEIASGSGRVWHSNRESKDSGKVAEISKQSGGKKFKPEYDLSKAPKKSMPHKIKPMLAKLVAASFDDPDWLFEIKWDGFRAIAEIDNGKVELYSRNQLSFNAEFKEIVRSLETIKHQAIFDGEVVVVDREGRSQFQLLQNFRKLGTDADRLLYYIFDILYLNGRDLRPLALEERKKILAAILPDLDNVLYSAHIPRDGKAFFKAAQKKGLEGILAKEKNSPYRGGKRTGEWLKIKTHLRQEAVVGGFTAPRGGRKGFGALVLGVYEGNDLIYIGHTGGGFNDQTLRDTFAKLKPLIAEKSPFKIRPKTNAPATWVQPRLVCEVQFSAWTEDGQMRQPIFIGLRPDKDARDVHREIPESIQKVLTAPSDPDRQNQSGKLQLSHLDKVFWPKEKYTKGDVIDYYRKIAPHILPYLKDRPESMNRYPNGIAGKSFFQKDVGDTPPEWVKTVRVHSENENRDLNYLLCQDPDTLLYMANLGCIEINPWNSRVGKLDHPDWLVIDLDPEKIAFDAVVKTAQEVKKVLDRAGCLSFCKTSGATGLHIFVPLATKYDYDQAKEFAHLVAMLVNRRLPEITSIERSPKKRQGKVYLDYLQNRRGQTLAAPYSLRPRPGATVSTPLLWREVRKGLDPLKFNIKTIFKRLEKHGDLWQNVLGKGADLAKALKNLSL